MTLSSAIAEMIVNMMNEENEIEIQRNILAGQLGCAPSQINYVLSSRFTPEHGYFVESRRGGGGFIKIARLPSEDDTIIVKIINSIGCKAEKKTCESYISNLLLQKTIDEKTASVMRSALSDKALKTVPFEKRSEVRAEMFKQMLLALAT